MSFVLKGGRIIDPSTNQDFVGDLWVENGSIRALDSTINADNDIEVYDVKGMIVCPGFVDLHCHLREPGGEEKETIATGTASAAKGGFTTVCAMPNTNPTIDTTDLVSFVIQKALTDGIVRVLPIASVTKGRAGLTITDMEDLSKAGAVAFSDDGSPVYDRNLMMEACLTSIRTRTPIINHCECTELSGTGVMNEGLVSRSLGLSGWPNEAEESMVARDIMIAEETKGHIHLAHISTEKSVELIRSAKERGVSITAEATPHHLTLTDELAYSSDPSKMLYNTYAKVNPPLRTRKDVDSLVRGLSDDTIDCIATDHAPHTGQDKSGSFEDAAFGISVLETALGSVMSLTNDHNVSITKIIEKLTCGPAKILGIHNIQMPSLQPGSIADITIFDPNEKWTVDTEDFISKGKNTPLKNRQLQGRVVATFVGGNLVFRRGESSIAQ